MNIRNLIKSTSGKGPNVNFFIWVRRDTLLIHFSRSTSDSDVFKWVFYNVTTGTEMDDDLANLFRDNRAYI